MRQDPRGNAEDGAATLSLNRLALIGAPIVFVAYAVVLGVARALPITAALAGGLANTVPTLLFGLIAYKIVRARLVGRSRRVQVAGHALLGTAYAIAAYWLLLVMLGVVNGQSLVHFTVIPFPTRSSVWQILQNLTTYGIVAALPYVYARRAGPAPAGELGPAGSERFLTRYFIRSGDEIRPIDVAMIVSMTGADDYVEVVTKTGKHLARMTLAEFDEVLDASKFIRVHRSHIVNIDRVDRAEPAGGGRMILHMEAGDAILTSRSGARLVRERVI